MKGIFRISGLDSRQRHAIISNRKGASCYFGVKVKGHARGEADRFFL